MDALVKALPYRLPRTTREAVFALAVILDIPRGQVRGDQMRVCIDDAFLLGTMAGVMLYRHLPPHEKRQVIARCRKLLANRLSVGHSLMNRILATWGVTPDWGVWSMSNEELQKMLNSDAKFRFWLGEIEKVVPTGGGLGSVLAALYKHPGAVPVALIGLIISGVANVADFETDYADSKYRKELSQRQILLTSKYYR